MALNFFDNFDLSDWFNVLKYVPSIFVNVLRHIDKELTKSLATLSPIKQRRVCYNYLIFNFDKFLSLINRRCGVSVSENEMYFIQFLIFKICVEYAGKATNARSDEHFINAKKVNLGLLDSDEVGDHVNVINDCWNNGVGVMCIQFESGATTFEALCREAAVISCLGIDNIKNKISGSIFGEMKSWSPLKLKNFGNLARFAVLKNSLSKDHLLLGLVICPYVLVGSGVPNLLCASFAEINWNKEYCGNMIFLAPNISYCNIFLYL